MTPLEEAQGRLEQAALNVREARQELLESARAAIRAGVPIGDVALEVMRSSETPMSLVIETRKAQPAPEPESDDDAFEREQSAAEAEWRERGGTL